MRKEKKNWRSKKIPGITFVYFAMMCLCKSLVRYVKEVTEQIKERELQRLLEAERKEEESKMINRALIATQKEEEEKRRKKQEGNMKLREELHKANMELERYRLLQKEEERIAEMRVNCLRNSLKTDPSIAHLFRCKNL